MKKAIGKQKKLPAVILCAVIAAAGLFAASHLYFHRSVMATLSEMWMLIIDRDAIYAEGEEFDKNIQLRTTDNLEDQYIPKGVKMTVPYTYKHEYGMQVYYFNEECLETNSTVLLYIPGGGYLNPPLKYHWKLINTLSSQANCTVVMPIYLKVPNYTCSESYEAMTAFYKEFAQREGIERIVIAGDSSGGGMALVLSQLMRDNYPELLQPDDIILIAPWMDVSMENKAILDYEPIDPMLELYGTKTIGEMWAGELDVHDPMVSPIYGTFRNLGDIIIFVGTRDMLCPDCLRFSDILTQRGIEHTLIVKEDLDHPYPLFPIPEAKEAQQMMIDIING